MIRIPELVTFNEKQKRIQNIVDSLDIQKCLHTGRYLYKHITYLIKRTKIPHYQSITLIEKVFFRFGVMVFNATFNNISATPWRSVLLMEETGGPGENPRPAASH